MNFKNIAKVRINSLLQISLEPIIFYVVAILQQVGGLTATVTFG